MPIIGIREFKNRASEIVRKVRDGDGLYIITLHGKPSAMIIPLDEDEVEKLVSEHHPFMIMRRSQKAGRRVGGTAGRD